LLKIIKIIVVFLSLALQVGFSNASVTYSGGHYWISFTDKSGTPFSINQPNQFLSQRSIDRRYTQSIPITETDLPPNPSYVNAIKSVENIDVYYTSRWFNGVLVYSKTGLEMSSVAELPFVSEVELVKPNQTKLAADEFVKVADKFDHLNNIQQIIDKAIINLFAGKDLGLMAPSIEQLNGQYLLNEGYFGEGKMIAVLDAGFSKVDQLEAFEHLRLEDRLKGVKDFVDPNQNIYNSHAHGTVVLSVMAAILPGQLFGTGTGADYWLIRTEDGATEFRIEEYNWLAGAELADSAGVDIINSSLGYTEFDAPWQNYTYQQMDGKTTVVAKAANFAHERGMVVVASAGNSGQSSWRHIVSPSDAFGALSIGAVNTNGERAPFSSVGPSADGRIKPDIMAHGWGVPVVPPSGNIGTTSGTSLSSPVISGLVAALWQKFPAATAPQIIDAVIKSSSQFNNPDEFYGYGIPDFLKASLILQNAVEPPEFIELNVFPNPFWSHSTIVFYSNQPYSAIIEIFNLAGKRVYRDSNIEIVNGTNFVSLANLHHIENGTYLLRMVSKDGVFLSAKKIIKLSK